MNPCGANWGGQVRIIVLAFVCAWGGPGGCVCHCALDLQWRGRRPTRQPFLFFACRTLRSSLPSSPPFPSFPPCRQRLIGKTVSVHLEYTRKVAPAAGGEAAAAAVGRRPGAEERVMSFGSVTVAEGGDGADERVSNVAELLLVRGLVQVVKHRSDEERSGERGSACGPAVGARGLRAAPVRLCCRARWLSGGSERRVGWVGLSEWGRARHAVEGGHDRCIVCSGHVSGHVEHFYVSQGCSPCMGPLTSNCWYCGTRQ
jgi:hypothetical protein